MRKVKVEEAVGMVLCHDITRIVPGEFKGPAFKKGHVITEEDIPELLKLGKEYIYIWECGEDDLHEDEAAVRIARVVSGHGIELTGPAEGKITMSAAVPGLFKVDVERLCQINEIEDVIVSTRHTNQVVKRGDVLAGTRVIPLVVKKEKVEQVEQICLNGGPILEVRAFRKMRAGIVTTGNEVFYGRIQDRFGPVVIQKLESYGCPVEGQVLLPDDAGRIAAAIRDFVDRGVELVVVTGGMSVDPDDVTPTGIRMVGAEIVTYGTPVLPGAMFLLAYLGSIPILGLPACVMYFRATVFDLVLPRVLAGDLVSRKELARLGHGGLCLNCPECRYPICPFGKGH